MARPTLPAEPARRLVTKVDGTILAECLPAGGQEILNQAGTGTFALALDDPQNADCVIGAVVTQELDGTAVAGEWLIAEREVVRLDPDDDESQLVVSYVCDGYSPKDAIVYPAQGIYEVPSGPMAGLKIATKPYSDDRYFGPMERYYDDSGWAAATEALAPHGPFRPEGFPDYDAWWIWDATLVDGAHPTGTKWFRATFTPASAVVFAVKIVLASLDAHEVYLDGTLISKTDPAIDTNAATKARAITVEINGDQPHTIAARVDHTSAGAGGFLCAVYEHGTANVLTRTDPTWLVADIGDEPGMTPGGVLTQLYDEAQDRGALVGHGATFSATTDTRGEPWPTIVGDFAVRVLDGYDDVVDQIAEGWMDWWYEPGDGPNLSAVTADGVPRPGGTGTGRGGASGVTFAEGVNCTELAHAERDTTKTVALARWGDGFIEGQIDEAVTARGRREVGLALSSINSGPSTLWTMLANLKPVSTPEVSIIITIEPDDETDTPLLAFRVGDRVTAPDANGEPTTYRVMAISWDEDDDGALSWRVELATARDVQEQVWHRWLRRTGNGTLDGRSRSATVTSPSIMNAGTVAVIEKQWGIGGAEALVGDRGDPWRPRERQIIYRLELECDVPGATGDTTVQLYDGISPGPTVTLAVTEGQGWADITEPILVDTLDTLNVETIAAGGHTGVTFTYLAFPTQ